MIKTNGIDKVEVNRLLLDLVAAQVKIRYILDAPEDITDEEYLKLDEAHIYIDEAIRVIEKLQK